MHFPSIYPSHTSNEGKSIKMPILPIATSLKSLSLQTISTDSSNQSPPPDSSETSEIIYEAYRKRSLERKDINLITF